MNEKDILVIGAGASGLMAMKKLLEAGYTVSMLEAANHAGGRMMTYTDESFTTPVELGAEFIHGDLPLTFELLKEGNIPFTPAKGKMIQVKNGEWNAGSAMYTYWDEMMERMEALENDTTIQSFLDINFNKPEHEAFYKSIQGFAEGFDLADISNASVLSVKDEWNHSDERQYRVNGGYIKLVDFLVKDCKKKSGKFYFDTLVSKIEHRNNKVVISTIDGKIFTADKVAITVSAGILKSESIAFPTLPNTYHKAFQQLGFGSVIKILLEFKNAFWGEKDKAVSFVLSNESVPTWWTQSPQKNTVLTGWLGGPKAERWSEQTETAILRTALLSLSSIFQLDASILENNLTAYKIVNWHMMPYARGGYSYNTIHSAKAKNILIKPVDDAIYFAGEALHSGDSIGTVEAALQSGVDAAERIIQSK